MNSRTIFLIFTNSRSMEEGRFSQFYEHDIVILRITNHECIGIQEFTNIFFQFSRILEQHFFFSRVTKDIVFTFF